MLADRYVLGALLGTGGMAEVFEGVAHGAHGFVRRVAVKRILPAQASDPGVVRLFLDEARIASKLHHAGIVAVLDYAVVDDVPFQVLELIDGWNVGQLGREATRRQQSLPLEIALYLATEAAHALAYAHEATDERGTPLGIVHRDVKPSNIMVSRDGAVKLGDFGIALARDRASKTTGCVIRGTPPFMAPEQLMGATVDARADVFAMGCTLHVFLTGHSPLSEETARAAIVHGTKLPVSGELPPGIFAIIERAVSVMPDARFHTARELAQALGVELWPLLRTDPKSRMIEWLQGLAVPPPATTTISNTVLTVAPQAATRLTATLVATDRVFSSTTPLGGPVSFGGPASFGLHADPTSLGAPPYGGAHGASLAPRTAGMVTPTVDGTGMRTSSPAFGPPNAVHATLDGTVARGTSPAFGPPPHALSPPNAAPADHGPPKGSRALVFGIAVMVPLLLAIVAGIGILVMHQLSPSATGPVAKASATVDGAAPPPTVAVASTTAAASDPRPAVPRAKGVPADASAPPAAGGAAIAGNTAPVSGGCICNAPTLGGGSSGVCHPQLAQAPQCRCRVALQPMCFAAYSKEGTDTSTLCPERIRTMPSSARDGDACTAFLEFTETKKNAAGQLVDFTSTRPASTGGLSCSRCSGGTGRYPRTQGAPCSGVRSSDGALVQGTIRCD